MSDLLIARWSDRLLYDPDTECLLWVGQTNNWGYGVVSIDGTKYALHRVLYEILVGPIPEGMQIDHTCRNRACQNLDHLQVLTKSENVALGRLRKTHCPQGHPYSGDNLYYDQGCRKCRTCNRARCRLAAQRRRLDKEPS